MILLKGVENEREKQFYSNKQTKNAPAPFTASSPRDRFEFSLGKDRSNMNSGLRRDYKALQILDSHRAVIRAWKTTDKTSFIMRGCWLYSTSSESGPMTGEVASFEWDIKYEVSYLRIFSAPCRPTEQKPSIGLSRWRPTFVYLIFIILFDEAVCFWDHKTPNVNNKL